MITFFFLLIIIFALLTIVFPEDKDLFKKCIKVCFYILFGIFAFIFMILISFIGCIGFGIIK